MARTLTVVFNNGKEFEFTLTEAELAGIGEDAAWRWFDREYAELDCQASSPVGKVLVIDKILNVARFSGERRFSGDAAWAQEFARHAGRLLDRDKVRVDVGNASIGF
ncbi:hypothetical protein [Cupriavidus plantarum]|uniref:Uncharacterized protein n=1 Tax=Cupriavidus plantarum TaxID=942865 RepID=A0A316F1N0_9BURK|nr:hypothetical protein [Cupriavidus plantarum]NYH98158.1 hypothetical protein [Cupriavidus plantarum]PWK38212.1 hypothetical protein C7419_1012104 [Cupriavidus plantarum]REE91863.1 hypothetical protein C7418_3123 [Cupriavidus plantarum]RLK35413.1 hypothetical protein C7417_3178 [Cupriavidus plantarum]CAG2127594.1 hypothetical protein LMG26296_00634 [Cupriavidus plantarum]